MALKFDGVNQWAQVVGYKGIPGSNNRTVIIGLKGTYNSSVFWGWGTEVSAQRFVAGMDMPDNTFYISVHSGFRYWDAGSLLDGKWHMLTYILNGTKVSDMTAYVDDALAPVSSTIDKTINTGNNLDVGIGWRIWTYFAGEMKDFKIYNRALNEAEIKSIYQNANIVNGLQTRFLMNEKPEGSVAAGAGAIQDISTFDRHATQNNGPIYASAPLKLTVPVLIRIPPVVPAVYVSEKLVCGIPEVLILGQAINIYPYIDKLTKITEKRTFQRDKLITNHISQEVDNSEDIFSVGNNSSMFKGLNWRYDKFIIKNRHKKITWNGIIEDIVRNHNTKKAKILSTDQLYVFKDTKIAYTSSDWETISQAFKNICDLIGFTDYNLKSIEDSSAQYIENNCYIKCHIELGDNVTHQQIAEKLAEIGCADCFTHKNQVYFKHWTPYTGGVKVNLNPKSLRRQPIIRSLKEQIINAYNIGYEGCGLVPATDENSNNIGSFSRDKFKRHDLREIRAQDNSQIVLKDKVSAVYIGECYMRRPQIGLETGDPKMIQAIEISLPGDDEFWIDINDSFFTLDYPDESWNVKIFETMFSEIEPATDNIDLIAYGIQEE